MTGIERKPHTAPPTHKRTIKNPGATTYNGVYSKRNPRPIDQFTDLQLLALVLGNPVAAQSVMDKIGKLENFSSIGEGASLLHYPGISKATAVKLDALFEVATRIG